MLVSNIFHSRNQVNRSSTLETTKFTTIFGHTLVTVSPSKPAGAKEAEEHNSSSHSLPFKEGILLKTGTLSSPNQSPETPQVKQDGKSHHKRRWLGTTPGAGAV